MKKLLIFILLFSQVSLGDEFNGAKFLNQGEVAPFSGFLLIREKVEKFRLLELDYNFELKKNEILEKQLNIAKEQIDKNNQYIDTLSKRLVEVKDDGFWNKFLFFTLGCLVTTGIAFGVSRTIR